MPESHPIAQVRVLLVEDSASQAALSKMILEKNNFQVILVGDGREAIEHLTGQIPDVIVSDIMMPRMNGYQLCRAIRSEPRWQHIPLILLTTLRDPSDILKGIDAGADNFILKPINESTFIPRLNYVLHNRELLSERTPDTGFPFVIEGKEHHIHASRSQMMGLLLSSYEAAMERGMAAEAAQESLLQKTKELERIVAKRTLDLKEEALAAHHAEEEFRKLNAEMEQRVLERTAELREAKEQAESADHLKSAFLTTMSQELRAPLNSIIGFSGMLLKQLPGPLNAEQSNQLRLIRDCGWQLLALINDVVDLSKIESGQVVAHSAEFQLPDAIHRAVESLRSQAEQKNIRIETTIDPSVGAILSDRRCVTQILYNLISHAIRFTDGGMIAISAVPDTTGNIHLTVTDTGGGIPREQKDNAFQPFYRGQGPLGGRDTRSRIGLTICQRLVRMLGGKIFVTNPPDGGTTVTVFLHAGSEKSPRPEQAITHTAGLPKSP